MAIQQSMLFAMFLVAAFILVLIPVIVPLAALGIVFIVLGLICDIIAFSTRFYAYLYEPFLKMKNRTLILRSDEPFILSPAGNAIVVREGEFVYASAFVKVPVYSSATEMSDDEKVDFASLFGRSSTISKNPFKIGTQLCVINKDAYIGRIRDKLNDAEQRYQTYVADKNAPKDKTERARGELTMWHNLYDNVTKTPSTALINYAMVTALGGNEEEAVNLAIQQADEIASGMGAIFGVAASLVQGPELLTLIEPEYIIPTGTVGEQMRQKGMAAGM